MNKTQEEIWFPEQHEREKWEGWDAWDDFIKRNYREMTDRDIAEKIREESDADITDITIDEERVRQHRVEDLGIKKEPELRGKLKYRNSIDWHSRRMKEFLKDHKKLDWVRLTEAINDEFDSDIKWTTVLQKDIVREIVNHRENYKKRKSFSVKDTEDKIEYIEKYHPDINDNDLSKYDFVRDFVLKFDINRNPLNVKKKLDSYLEEEYGVE